MKRNLFRKNAMLKMMSPLELDRSLVIVSRRNWLVLLSLGLLTILVVYWSIFGKIYERITGSGVILTKQGIYTAYAPAAGRIVSLNVSAGDYVQKGDLIATLLLPEARSEIQNLNSKIERRREMQRQILAFNESITESSLKQKNQLQESLNSTIEILKEQIEWHDDFLRRLGGLRRSGSTSEKDYVEFREGNDRLTMSLGEKITELKRSETEYLLQKKSSDYEELQLDLELVELTEELYDKISLYRLNSQVISDGTGYVTSVLAEPQMFVATNQALVNISDDSESHDDGWVLYAYYSLLNSGKIEPGMSVLVTPSMVKAEKDGSIRGVVHSVNSYVQPAEALNLKYRNQNFSEAIFKMSDNMPVEVKIVLNGNPENFSGFEWTSGAGPNIRINEGTYCSASIAVDTLRPLELVFAKLRKVALGSGVNEEFMGATVKEKLK